ncbi:bromodomain-containing protein 8 [Drosophila biarmipes]|uniref:bromodomain-containing protein 8 n=1 Tax=Drosophila biarmipes TaxID=125945 RepID=UPI0007E75ACF|nr:bromodomain-containing protein 8 [Drosophila biarmipes]
MSAGVQERLQLSRVPLDTWSKREQLILASAVSCSGDQNWITVSRTLKAICGNGNGNGGGHNSSGNNRPADWFSQKNCAVQYGNLLESVEATKRKKRSSESSTGVSSPATVETPTELLLRRLTEERQAEIKAQMRQDQETYRRIQREIDSLQSDAVTEQELQDMWLEIEKEQETRRIEEMKLENRMREREQRKKEMAANWRNSSPASRRSNQTADTTSVDMDVEDINSSSSGSGSGNGNGNGKQQTGPSPLLTSLLKSPTGNAPATPISGGGAALTGAGSVARVTAPTITSLLTSGGSSAVSSQPVITMKSPTDAAFMSRPISGPPVNETLTPTTPTLERSPSQAAPTLSMLLEKNKAAAKANEAGSLIKPEGSGGQEQSSADDTALATTGTADSDETDPNVDQLLEDFPNIDEIIDDIDIDMASVIDDDILKDVDDVVASPSNDKAEVIDFEDKLDALKREQSKSSPASDKPKSVELVLGSSDDSNDNIPLAAVASQESKDRGQSGSESTRGTEDAESEPLTSEVAVEEIGETITIISTSSEDTASSPPTKIEEEVATDSLSTKEEAKDAKAEQDSSANNKDGAVETTEGPGTTDNQSAAEAHKAGKEATEKSSSIEEKVATPSTPASAPVPGSLHDTDEESSSLTDSSKQDEQPRSAKAKPPTSKLALDDSKSELELSGTPQPPSAPARTPLLRKLPHRDRSESPMVDDDATTASDHSTARSTRRRCSSTPVIDSVPNSPASSEHTDDRRETRAASKKLFLSIYAMLQDSKHAAPFKRPFHDEHAQRHADLCLRPMDFPTIKRNIDSGFIRSLSELHRDVLLMANNVLVAYKPHTNQHKTARLFVQDCQAIKEFSQMPDTQVPVITATPVSNTGTSRAEKSSGSKARSGSRKSQRHH